MDGCSGKSDVASNMAHRKGYNATTYRDASADRDHNPQYCHRIGCNGRMKHNNQSTKLKGYEKAKCSNSSFNSSHGNEVVGKSSSKSTSVLVRSKSSFLDSKRKLSSQLELDSSESSQSDGTEGQELTPSPSRSATGHYSGSMNKPIGISLEEAETSSLPSNMKSRKKDQQNSNSQNMLSASSGPSIPESSGSVNSNNRSRYHLRNLKCNSESDALTPSCSSESKATGKYMMKKKVSEGESSISRRGRQANAPEPTYRHRFTSTGGISISDSRRNNCTSGEGSSGAAAVRPRRSVNLNDTRIRLSYRQVGTNDSTVRESAIRTSLSPDSDIHINVDGQSSSQQFSMSGSSSGLSRFSLSSGNDDMSTLVPFTSTDMGFTHVINRDAFPLVNIDGIAEILLALGRIERDEELTHEQVLALETSLLLSGLNLYDQHRGMRMDIDNMSYEELLALEERMGSVSTALSEEQLLKCISKSIYQANSSDVRVPGLGEDGDDIKCCICQEEYTLGDEIGKLVECQHGYHSLCIKEWLRMKNWCPICKKAAAPAPPPPSQSLPS